MKDWKKKFDNLIVNFHDDGCHKDKSIHCPCDCVHEIDKKKYKDFISGLLQQQKEEIESKNYDRAYNAGYVAGVRKARQQ